MRVISISVLGILFTAAIHGAVEPAPQPDTIQTCWEMHERFANQALGVRDYPELDAARRHLQQAIDCMTAAAKPSERARILERLALLSEEPETAIAYYREALRLRRSAGADDDPGIPDTLWNLGSNEIETGRRAEGLGHIEEAHRIQERILGPDHPQTAEGLYRLGLAYFTDGQPKKGEAYYRRSIAILEKQPLTEDNLLPTVVLSLGDRLYEIGRCGEGQALRDLSLQLSLDAAKGSGEAAKPH